MTWTLHCDGVAMSIYMNGRRNEGTHYCVHTVHTHTPIHGDGAGMIVFRKKYFLLF